MTRDNMPPVEVIFWRQTPESTAWPWDIYESLIRQQPVEWVLPLPTGVIVKRIQNTFPDCVDSGGSLRWASPTKGAFVVRWSSRHFMFDLYELVNEDKNRLYDVMAEYDCPPYDTISAERYGLESLTTRDTSFEHIFAKLDYLYANGRYVYEPTPEHNWYVCQRSLWREMEMYDREKSY